MNSNINSIAIYGSLARNDFDQYSDKDLLVVSDTFEDIFTIEKFYNDQGYSCSAYTFERLKKLSKKRSLFIQHLKQDSKIILDNGGKLSSLLTNYKPKKDYNTELQEAIAYFNLLNVIPDSIEGIGWAFDIIAIGIRNYNILHLANHCIYEFSIKDILSNSKKFFNLSEEEVALLLNTRIVKKNYRNKNFDLIPGKVDLIQIIQIINKRYNIKINPTFIGKNDFATYSFNSIYTDKSFTPYQKLRLFEGYIYSLKSNINTTIIEKFKRIIENPKFYVSHFYNKTYIENLLIDTIQNENNGSS